jgi:hypothetical protein
LCILDLDKRLPLSWLVQALEFQAQQRLWALQQEEVAAAGSSALRDAAATQASALAAQLQRKAADWSSEDEARSLKQQHELARKARLAAAAEQEAALQAAKGLLLAQELQTQEELAKVGVGGAHSWYGSSFQPATAGRLLLCLTE